MAPSRPVLPDWKRPGDEGAKAAGLVLQFADARRCSTRSSSVSTLPNIMVAVPVMPCMWASRMTPSHVPGVGLARSHLLAHAVHQDLGAAARQRVEPRRLQPAQGLGHRAGR